MLAVYCYLKETCHETVKVNVYIFTDMCENVSTGHFFTIYMYDTVFRSILFLCLFFSVEVIPLFKLA
jgi:hypothetical protein